MIARRRVCLALATAIVSVTGLGAQLPTDTTLLKRADSIRVGDYCRLARRILADGAVLRALASDTSSARASAAAICNTLLTPLTLRALAGHSPASIKAVARLDASIYSAAQLSALGAMTEFRADVRTREMAPVVGAALGPADSAEFIRVSDTAHELEVRTARDRALQRLANYERKLGPTSARLNGPEVLLNYAAQRWIPGFKATPLGGPSPWEVVSSYAPGYVTFPDGNSTPIPVSAAEFGVRYYLFGERFGKSGIAGVLLPSYWSAGVLTASDENGALVWPWHGSDRSGGYVSWGSIKVGYIKRDRGSWLVTKQFQAVPFLF